MSWNHRVPKALLGYFETEASKSRKRKKKRRNTPKSVYLYDRESDCIELRRTDCILGEDDNYDKEEEDFYEEYETSAMASYNESPSAYSKLITGLELEPDDRKRIAGYLWTIDYRSLLHRGKLDSTVVDQDRKSERVGIETLLRFRREGAIDTYVADVSKRSWIVCETESDLVLGDSPIVLDVFLTKDRDTKQVTGRLNSYNIPLSPDRLLMILPPGKLVEMYPKVRVPHNVVRWINKKMVHRSERYVVSRESREVKWMRKWLTIDFELRDSKLERNKSSLILYS